MTAPALYPYQRDVIAEFRSYASTAASAASFWWRPPDAGKTVIGADIIRVSRSQSKIRRWCSAHRREIITQTSKKLTRSRESRHGIIQAGCHGAPA